MSRHDSDTSNELRALSAPVLLLSTAFFVMVAFQTYELVRDRMALTNVRTQQNANMQQSLRLRQQLNAVASGISRLADSGDQNAQTIIDNLRSQGISVRENAAPAQR